MFKCDWCKEFTKPNESANKVTVETREVKYTNVINGKIKETFGWEIVKEANYCSSCNKGLNNDQTQ